MSHDTREVTTTDVSFSLKTSGFQCMLSYYPELAKNKHPSILIASMAFTTEVT